ncbi:MAG: transglycosylase domain-containing protein [Bdellovibrionales bacterium]|nr:transglycosylase domain-containing protein [Bdellovibrionales bacterium]
MIKKILYLLVLLTTVFGAGSYFFVQRLSKQVDQALQEGWFPPSLEYYAQTDSEPVLFAQREGEQSHLRKRFKISEVPYLCLQAITLSEDKNFLLHKGASISSILRALIKNLQSARIKEGGSTITQQLVKNKFLSHEKTFRRKWTELIISLILESKLTKDEILELYLNTIYMGHTGSYSLYGFASASRYYFNKNLKNLKVHECALLTAIVPSPGRLNPFSQSERALSRRNIILQKIKEQGFISEEEWEQAKSKTLPSFDRPPTKASYFVQAVDQELKELGIDLNQNLKVYTTIDLKIQNQAYQTFKKTLKTFPENLEGALVFVDLKTNQVKALIGGKNFRQSQFNRALNARRPVGSLVKPWTYLSALIYQDLDPLSPLTDELFIEGNWSPKNYKNRYYGKVPLYFALTHSLNTASARLALQTGLGNILKTFKNLGMTSSAEAHPSIGLGALELSPLEVSQMYATLARMGSYQKLSFIEKITSHNVHANATTPANTPIPAPSVIPASTTTPANNVIPAEARIQYTKDQIIYQNTEEPEQKLSEQKTAVIIGMMKQVINTGTAKWIKDFWPMTSAGKTGTSNEERDSWFAGFTPEYLAVTWIGHDDNSPHGLSGSAGALSLWLNFMKTLDIKDKDFKWPSGIKSQSIPNQDILLIKEVPSQNEEEKTQFFSLEESQKEEIELVFEK